MKMYLNGAEMMIKLSGSALKNLLAFLLALSKEHKKLYGKVNMGRMLKETRDLRTFTMTEKQYNAFKSQAKKQGILFAAVTDKDSKGKVMDVILPATEVDRANVIFERILYDPALGTQSPEPPQTEKKHWWQRIFHRGGREEPAEEPTPEAGAGSEHGTGTEHEAGREHGTEPGTDSGNPTPPALDAHRERERPEPAPERSESEQVIVLGLPAPQEPVREMRETEVFVEVMQVSAPEVQTAEHGSPEAAEHGQTPPIQTEEATPEVSGREELKAPAKGGQPTPVPQREQAGMPQEKGVAESRNGQKDAARSGKDSPSTSDKSTPKKQHTPPPTTKNDKQAGERTSVIGMLEGFKKEEAEKAASAPEKGKEASKEKGGKEPQRREGAKKGKTRGGKGAKAPIPKPPVR